MTECSRCRQAYEPTSASDVLCPACRGEMARLIQQQEASRRRPPLSFWLHSPTAILIAVNVLVFVAMAASLHSFSPSPDKLIRWGANFGPLTLGGQWWRLLTLGVSARQHSSPGAEHVGVSESRHSGRDAVWTP